MKKFKIPTFIKSFVKKTPILLRFYRFYTEDFPFLFKSYPEVMEIQGSKMYLNVLEKNPDLRRTFRAYAKNKIHEPVTTKFFRHILKPNNVYLDLGANIGYFSLLASQLVGPAGRVFSFEPEERNFKLLSKNKELNAYSQLTPVNKAASNQNGKTKLFICPYDTGHHTINQNEGITSYDTIVSYDKEKIMHVEIDTVSVDDFLLRQGISSVDLIKMDVEGAELLAVQGMEKTLGQDKVKMVVEFFPLLIEKMGCSPRALLEKFINDFHFELFEIADDYSSHEKEDSHLLKRIDNYNEILKSYERDKMYHINIFLIKKTHPQFDHLINVK